jgi:hypothetical protein
MAGKYSEAAWKALASELISFKGRLLKKRLRFFSNLQFVLPTFHALPYFVLQEDSPAEDR